MPPQVPLPPDPDAAAPLVIRPAHDVPWGDLALLLDGGNERGCWCQAWRGFTAGIPNEVALRAQLEAARAGAEAPPGFVA